MATVALVLVAVTAIGTSLASWTARPRPAAPLIQVGDTVEVLRGPGLPTGPALVIHLRSDCKYCTESMPFYRRLVQATSRLPVIAVGYEQRDVLVAYLQQHGLLADHVITLRAGSLRTGGTPTLILIDSTRTASAIWRGYLTDSEEMAVAAAIQH
jgi:hypothetical protein